MGDEETKTWDSSESLPTAHDDDGYESGKPGNSRRRHKQRQLLAELLSELTDDEEDEMIERSEEEEIMKEINNIKRQNRLTHFLLTASILVTLAWQLSEFSLIFKIKQGFNHPLRSIGGAIKGLFYNEQDAPHKQLQVMPPTHLPGLMIPDLPHLDLIGSTTSNEDDD